MSEFEATGQNASAIRRPRMGAPLRSPSLFSFQEHVFGLLLAGIIVAAATLFALGYFLGFAFLSWGFAGTFVLHMCTRPSRREVLATFGVAAALLTLQLAFRGPALVAGNPVEVLKLLGLGSLVVLGVPIPWQRATDLRVRLANFQVAVALPLFCLLTVPAHHVTVLLHPQTLDHNLYAFDASLGFQPSFQVGRVLAQFWWLHTISYVFYSALPLGIAVLYGSARGARPPKPGANVLFTCAVAGVFGFLLYQILPAAGPLWVFGEAFPSNPPALAGLSTSPTWLAREIPRNAMPSLHFAWALMLWWSSAQSPRWIRAMSGLFVGFTCLATLGLGEHYLIDLIVAVPFALAVQAACSLRLSGRSPSAVHSLVAGAGMTILWLGFLRLGVSLFSRLGFWGWILAGATVVYSLILGQRIRGALQPESRWLEGSTR